MKDTILPDILSAGVDTTANAAAFALYCIATNPDKQKILREEIMKTMNSEEEFTGKVCIKQRNLNQHESFLCVFIK